MILKYGFRRVNTLSHTAKQCNIIIQLSNLSTKRLLPGRINIAIITEHYQNRLNFVGDFHCGNSTLLETFIKDEVQHVHHIKLNVDPDQFEKLPPKCSACGVVLQANNDKEIGYLPKDKFMNSVKENTVNKLACYDCFQLRYYSKGDVTPRLHNVEIKDQLGHLRRRKALILYIIDIFDIEGTLVPNLLQLIGKRKRLIIVGNKMDRIPRDFNKMTYQIEYMKDVLKTICFESGIEESNFRDICLVSGKTGFGLQTLIEKMNKHRDVNMDVYLVGCANTGKSTLYNLIVNMLNVHKSSSLPNQAIESHLPCTTLSLVRENISLRRLKRMQWRLKEEPWEEERTFVVDPELSKLLEVKPHQSKENPKKVITDGRRGLQQRSIEFVDHDYVKGKMEKQNYIYDTPGIFHDSQIIRYLTSKEINYLSPKDWIVPRTVILKPGNCVFLGGIGRIDYESIWRPKRDNVQEKDEILKSVQPIYITAMMSPMIPLHVTISETADERYERLFVNDILKLPEGTKERFDEYPLLKSKEYTIIGKGLNVNACDVVLHGIGWFSVSATPAGRVQLKVHTPNGIGQQIRKDPLLPYTVRGKSGRGKNYHGRSDYRMYGHTRRNSPSLVRLLQQPNDHIYAWKKKVTHKLKLERKQAKETSRLKRLEDGIFLGKWKTLRAKENEFDELLEMNKDLKNLLSNR